MEPQKLTAFLNDSSELAISLEWAGVPFEPGEDWALIFTAKDDDAVDDPMAAFQKASGAGITVSGSVATVELVPDDTEAMVAGIRLFDIQAQNIATGKVRTLAFGELYLMRDITRSTTVSIPIYTTEEYVARGPAGPAGVTPEGAIIEGDARLTDSRAPTAHKSTHATGGADAITPADIGAATAAQGVKADAAQPLFVGPYASNDAAVVGGVPFGNGYYTSDGSAKIAFPPAATTVAFFGDSRADQSGFTSTKTSGANGFYYWFMAATGHRLTHVRNTTALNGTVGDYAFAQGGQTWVTLNNDAGSYPRVAELIAQCPAGTVVLMHAGTNGMSDPATNFAGFVAVATRFRAAGLRPFAFIEPFVGASSTAAQYMPNVAGYNANVIAWCQANYLPYIDVRAAYNIADTITAHDYMFWTSASDTAFIHPNIRGASEVGVEFARLVESLHTLPDFPVTYTSIATTVANDRGFAMGQYNVTNSVSTSTTACTLARSFVARTDGQTGNWAKLEISNCVEGNATGAGAGNVLVTLGCASLPAEGSYRAVVEVEIDEWLETPAAAGYVNARYIRLMATAQGGTSSTTTAGGLATEMEYDAHTIGQRHSRNPANATKKIGIITDAFTRSAVNTSVAAFLTCAGNMKIRVGNMAIIPA